MIKALIFDFDGTILDTETPDYHCWQAIYNDHGTELPLQIWCQVVGTTWDAFNPLDHLEELIGRPINRDQIRESHREQFHRHVSEARPMEGVENLLAAAREAGLRLAVASSSRLPWVQGHLDRLGLLHYFEVLKTADDVERVKPDPALYIAALQALQLSPEEAIALEDSVNGVKAARAAGLHTIAIPNSITSQLDFTHANVKLSSLLHLDLTTYISPAS